MGLRDDFERFKEVGEKNREDLTDFVRYGDLGKSRPDEARIPVKIVDLPEFGYDKRDAGGVGQGGGEVGQPVDDGQPQPGEGDEGEPGEEGGEHEYYSMDPEEFANELDEELGLDLDPKGKDKVVETKEGPFTDMRRKGPDSTLDFDRMFKEGLKRKLATDFDEDYLREVMKVDSVTPRDVFEYARGENVPVSMDWIEVEYDDIPDEELDKWESIEEVEENVENETVQQKIRREGIDEIPYRPEDKRHRHPEIIEETENNVVIVNIRDVSGSMREDKRELVERTFVPLDWYLTGKYDNAETEYIAHDSDAWEVDREEFFGIKSGGGTKISSAYEKAKEILDEDYPFSEWNRYVFAAGDSENRSNDTDKVIELMEDIDANTHAYVEVQPGKSKASATHAEELEAHFGSDNDDYAVSYVNEPDDVTDAIYNILSTEEGDE